MIKAFANLLTGAPEYRSAVFYENHSFNGSPCSSADGRLPAAGSDLVR